MVNRLLTVSPGALPEVVFSATAARVTVLCPTATVGASLAAVTAITAVSVALLYWLSAPVPRAPVPRAPVTVVSLPAVLPCVPVL